MSTNNNNYKNLLTPFILLLGLFVVLPASAVDEPVQLTHGAVSGIETDNGGQAFLGIPYAAPPVGDLRWKAPQPPTPWVGTRPADNHPPACMQQGNAYQSEDCLYVNVWTNAETADENLPVMVWIHGGGWVFGSNATSIYDGEAFAENGVVLVSVNYRMSGFGWMAHPSLSAESPDGVSGNYGVLDHIAALEWVQENVAGFGGDPDNVTIFGESAGGGSIYALLSTPLAEGLFHKAISQSTWITSYNVTNLDTNNGINDSAEAQGETAVSAKLQELGVAGGDSLENMRAMSASDVLAMEIGVSIIVDGHVYPKSPHDVFAEGSQNNVPLLAGINSGEGLFFVRPNDVFSSVAEQQAARSTEFGNFAGDLLDYYVADSDDEIFNVEVDFNTDSWFARPTRQIIQSATRSGQDSFMYLFTRNARDASSRAPHAAELQYVFNNLGPRAADEDKEIAQLMNDYWVQFATTGSPNGNGLPQWPVYDLEEQQHKIIGVDVGEGSKFRLTELDELDRYFDERYASAP